MTQAIKNTGLKSMTMRHDPLSGNHKALFCLEDGDVELVLNDEFRINTTDARSEEEYSNSAILRIYYENLVLKYVRFWACSQEVSTNEGLVGESSPNTANMGHYAYLRIREDGRRYRHTQTQSEACLEEQGKDLATESERLKALDPTGRARNSTYVRENYDPSKPPLEVYYPEL